MEGKFAEVHFQHPAWIAQPERIRGSLRGSAHSRQIHVLCRHIKIQEAA
jgi:hypothetical protein